MIHSYHIIPTKKGFIIKVQTEDTIYILGTPDRPIIFPTVELASLFIAQEMKRQAPTIYADRKSALSIEMDKLLVEIDKEWQQKRRG